MDILVTGCNGQLGYELQQLATQAHSKQAALQWTFVDRQQLDITNAAAVQHFVQQHRPRILINAAAYTAVDKAESESEQAQLVNATAVGYLAQACQQYGCRLLHLSTDFVFDGTQNTPYHPHHPTHALGVYGRSKLAGEQLAQQHQANSIIVRTAWVYSAWGRNFCKTMLALTAQRPQLGVVYDQVGCPTYAADLAQALYHIAQYVLDQPSCSGGIYHYTNAGVASWYDLAVAVQRLSGSHCQISAIETHQYPTPARRPAYSVLATDSIQQRFGVSSPHWQDALHRWWEAVGSQRIGA